MAADTRRTEIRADGAVTPGVRRRERIVLREARPWSRTVISLLKHLEHVEFQGAPRAVGSGFAPDGREAVTYIPGSSPHPKAWADSALVALGTMLRELHEATASFAVPDDACWQPWFIRDLPGEHPVIGHGDTGPWNVVARRGVPVALIDWEFAGPVDALWAVAETAWLNAQLHDDDVAGRFGLPSVEQRAHQVRLLVDAYGLGASERVGFVNKMAEIAVHSARAEAVQHQVTADTTDAIAESGYPVMWAIAWRARSASWIFRHREILELALA